MVWGAGRCRSTSLSLAFDVSTEAECDDPWQGQASGGIAVFDTKAPLVPEPGWQGSTPGGYLRMAIAVPELAVQTISGGRQYAAFRLMINHARSNGPAACEGCSVPACIWIDHLRLTTPAEQSDKSQPSRNRDVVLTQGMPTCAAGAAKPSTWSDLKKRYK